MSFNVVAILESPYTGVFLQVQESSTKESKRAPPHPLLDKLVSITEHD